MGHLPKIYPSSWVFHMEHPNDVGTMFLGPLVFFFIHLFPSLHLFPSGGAQECKLCGKCTPRIKTGAQTFQVNCQQDFHDKWSFWIKDALSLLEQWHTDSCIYFFVQQYYIRYHVSVFYSCTPILTKVMDQSNTSWLEKGLGLYLLLTTLQGTSIQLQASTGRRRHTTYFMPRPLTDGQTSHWNLNRNLLSKYKTSMTMHPNLQMDHTLLQCRRCLIWVRRMRH